MDARRLDESVHVYKVGPDIHRLVMVSRIPNDTGEETTPLWIDLKMIPLTAEEYRVVKAYLHRLVAPVAQQVIQHTPEWTDIAADCSKDPGITVEQVYDVLTPRIMNWTLSITHHTPSPSVSKTPYAALALLEQGDLFNTALYVLRSSEVGGLPPANGAAA